MPEGTEPKEGENFREIFLWYFEVGKEAEAKALCMEWKNLYESKGIKHGYSTYSMLLGDAPSYAFIEWGTDESSKAADHKAAMELLGEEGDALWQKTLAITKKYDVKRGNVMSDVSYNYSSQ